VRTLALSLLQVTSLLSQPANDQDWQKHIVAGKRLVVQERYGEAEKEYQRALILAEKVPAVGPLTATLHHLAVLHQTMGRPAPAELLLRHAIRLRETAPGLEPIDLANDLRVLGLVLYYQRRFEEARPLFRRSLRIREEVQGPDHPDLVLILGSLAGLESQNQQFGEAEYLYRRALGIQMRGPEDRNLCKTLNNLGVLYVNLGRYLQAEPLLRQALSGSRSSSLVQRTQRRPVCSAISRFYGKNWATQAKRWNCSYGASQFGRKRLVPAVRSWRVS
jgi:tetratricopeptide (TPR) repeat protein